MFIKLLITLTLVESIFSAGCNLRQYEGGYVCVCNENYCDTLQYNNPSNPEDVVHVMSSESGLRHDINYLTGRPSKILPADKNDDFVELYPDESITYQKVLGLGNALTGSSSYLLNNLSPKLRHHVYESIFSKSKGNGIQFVRIPIGGCDFDLSPWAYNEFPENDKDLSNFTQLDERDLAKVRHINEIRRSIDAYDLKLLGAAWSSPKWMKTNNAWSGRSKLKPEFYQTWADYHVKYLELWDKQNINFWGISTGNEPLNGELFWLFVRFMSLGWNADRQGTFVGNHLGPTIRNSKFKDIKLFANDDQRYTVAWWFQDMEKSHNKSVEYIDGLAVHWYWDEFIPPTLLDDHHKRYPHMLIFNTEASVGDKPWESSTPILGSWKRAESYIEAIMEDFEHWVNGWIDWNLMLNLGGGPNYIDNFVDAPIIVNQTDYKEIYKQPFYYAFGHFSRFIIPESTRFNIKSSDKDVKVCAFQRPDGYKVIIAQNKKAVTTRLVINNSSIGYISVDVPAKSINTLLYI